MTPRSRPFSQRSLDLLEFLLPRYLAEGKSQLTFGVGCTGGRHRSVYVARRSCGASPTIAGSTSRSKHAISRER